MDPIVAEEEKLISSSSGSHLEPIDTQQAYHRDVDESVSSLSPSFLPQQREVELAGVDDPDLEHKNGVAVMPKLTRTNSLFELDESKYEEALAVASMTGYQYSAQREVLFWVLALATGFIGYVFSRWFPEFFISIRYKECPLADADYVLVKGVQNGYQLCVVEELSETSVKEQEPDCMGLQEPRVPPASTVQPQRRMILFRHIRFLFNPESKSFVRIGYLQRVRNNVLVDRLKRGLSAKEHAEYIARYGQNAIILIVASIPVLLIQEVFHPFFVFQTYSVILWCFEEYYIFAGAIAFIAISSIAFTLQETRSRLMALAKLAKYSCDVNVLRDGQFKTVVSTELVPGDIIEVADQVVLPCDLALVSGNCVVNESMLTGESVPVVKVAITYSAGSSDGQVFVGRDQNTTLFAGTQVLQAKAQGGAQRVLAMVVRTGFATTKGSLIISILFPRPSSFKFVRQSYFFIAFLFGIAMIGFIISIWRLDQIGADSQTMVIRALDLITIVVPPSLPLAMSVGTNFAMHCLRKAYIFCISPARINMAGKIRLMCFDKTGTLTSEGMEFKGVHPAVDGLYTQLLSAEQMAGVPADAYATMACCHALAQLRDELVGDPLEVKIFQASGATLKEMPEENLRRVAWKRKLNDEPPRTLDVKITFDFSSHLQRMSVIAYDAVTSAAYLFAKGSPEMMRTLCLPHTIPANYEALLKSYTKQGYRVIAIASKQLNASQVAAVQANLDRNQLRTQCETDLVFGGLVLLENKVKPETQPTLVVLRRACVRCVMVTGDNPFTAVSVAKECELVAPNSRVFVSHVVDASGLSDRPLKWVDSDDDGLTLDPATLSPLQVKVGSFSYELAMTGVSFKLLQDMVAAGAMSKQEFHKIILACQIFARMTPEQKAALVTELQSAELYVGMIGDGANDCAALRAAHVGISLSETEASIAAPFTYQRPNISCVPVLLSEGRSSLNTSFQLFRYMAMYSMIQFMCVILLYFKGSVLGNWQYLYQDLWVVFPLTIFMGHTLANRTLSIKRPSGDLLTLSNIANIVTHVVISMCMQIMVFTLTEKASGYEIIPNEDNGPIIWETTSLYYFANFQYVIMAALFSSGRPWKRHTLTNWRFTGWAAIVILFNMLLLFAYNSDVFVFEEDVDLPISWRRGIFGIVVFNTAISSVFEVFIYPVAVRLQKQWRRRSARMSTVFGQMKPLSGPDSKEYHRLRGEFESYWSVAELGSVVGGMPMQFIPRSGGDQLESYR